MAELGEPTEIIEIPEPLQVPDLLPVNEPDREKVPA